MDGIWETAGYVIESLDELRDTTDDPVVPNRSNQTTISEDTLACLCRRADRLARVMPSIGGDFTVACRTMAMACRDDESSDAATYLRHVQESFMEIESSRGYSSHVADLIGEFRQVLQTAINEFTAQFSEA